MPIDLFTRFQPPPPMPFGAGLNAQRDRASESEIGNIGGLQDKLQEFQEVKITTVDGKTGTVLMKWISEATADDLPFRVTAGAKDSGQVNVATGYISLTNEFPTKLSRYFTVAGTVLSVTTGQVVYLQANYAGSAYAGDFSGDVIVSGSPEPITNKYLQVDMLGSGGGSVGFVADAANKMGTTSIMYIPIAEVTSIDDEGNITVRQIFRGGLLQLPLFISVKPV